MLPFPFAFPFKLPFPFEFVLTGLAKYCVCDCPSREPRFNSGNFSMEVLTFALEEKLGRVE